MNKMDVGENKKIQRYIDRMPSMSTTVGKVLEVCSKTDASPNELYRVVSLDPVLTGQVLKLINSSYYSLVNQVTSLPRAITMLGMNTVKNMALSTAVIATMGGAKKNSALPMGPFWVHSLGVGVAAKLFGAIKGYGVLEREELFFAGLLHDLGKIPFESSYHKVLVEMEETELSLLELEQKILGIDHQYVGGLIANRWKFNQFLTEAICCHHNHEGITDPRIKLISLADCYMNCMNYGGAGNSHPDLYWRNQLLEELGLKWEQVVDMGEEVLAEIERAKVFLQV